MQIDKMKKIQQTKKRCPKTVLRTRARKPFRLANFPHKVHRPQMPNYGTLILKVASVQVECALCHGSEHTLSRIGVLHRAHLETSRSMQLNNKSESCIIRLELRVEHVQIYLYACNFHSNCFSSRGIMHVFNRIRANLLCINRVKTLSN